MFGTSILYWLQITNTTCHRSTYVCLFGERSLYSPCPNKRNVEFEKRNTRKGGEGERKESCLANTRLFPIFMLKIHYLCYLSSHSLSPIYTGALAELFFSTIFVFMFHGLA
jgi:hypothetical protein